MFLRITAIVIVTLILTSRLTSAQGQPIYLTLDEALAIALRDNRDILLKSEDIEKAKQKIAEAKGSLLPTLNFTGGWTYTKGYFNKDISQTQAQTTVKQYIYKGGKTINTIKYNGYKLEVSTALLDKARIEAALNVRKAFYTLLLAMEFCDLNRIIVENMKEHLAMTKERYKNGQASESDILNIEASLVNTQKAYELSKNQAEAALALLNNLLYLEEETRIKPDGEFKYEPFEVAYDKALLKALEARPEIKQLAAQVQADKKAIEIAKADGRPNIYASWDYYSRSHAVVSTINTKSWNDYSVIGATFSWPVFDGWITRAKVEQAIIDLKETELLKEKTTSDIVQELKNAYLSFKNAVAKIDAVESDVKVYNDNLSSIKQKCHQGIASLLDADDANLKYNVSLFNKKQALYDYIIAKASFDKATGGI